MNSSMALGEEELAERHPVAYAQLIPLLRKCPYDLRAYLQKVDCNVRLEGSRCSAHGYFITLGPTRKPRVEDFAQFIGRKITDFAISRTEIKRAILENVKTNSTVATDALNQKARKLFTKLPKSGEGGEVLLSVLTETFLGLPQIFTKMILKTDPDVHVHGCDGIHAGVDSETGRLALYWGESKLYSDATSAIHNCFSSLAPYLLAEGGSSAPQKRELQLMRDHLVLPDPDLIKAIKHYLDPDDPMFLQLEYRGLCLVGYDSDAYPSDPNSKEAGDLLAEISEAFRLNLDRISKRVLAENLHKFDIEVFCLPFPSVSEFRRAFRSELGFKDEQE